MSPTRYRLTLLSLAAGNFSVSLNAFVVIGILPFMAADLQISPAQAGLFMTVYALTYAITSPLLVSMAGRLSRRRLLIGALAAVALAAVMTAVAASPAVIFAARVLAAMGGGIFTPVAATVAYGLGRPEQRGPALTTVFIGLQLAQPVGGPIAVVVAQAWGWPAVFWVVLAVTLGALAGLWLSLSEEPPVAVSSLSSLRAAARDRLGLALILVTGLHVAAMCAVYAFLALLALAAGGSIALTLVLFGAGGILNSLMIGVLIPRLGLNRVRGAMLLGQVVLLPLFSLPLLGFGPLPTALFYLIVWCWAALAVGLMVPQQMLLMERRPQQSTTLISLNATSNFLGVSAGSALGGLVITQAGLNWLGLVGGLMAVVTLGFAIKAERIWTRRGLS